MANTNIMNVLTDNMPKTRLENALCNAFKIVLNTEKIGTTDDFIALGGNPDSASEIVKICERYNISVDDILNGKTPRDIARLVEEKDNKYYTELNKEIIKVPLTDSQTGIYLECVLNPDSKMYNIPMHFTVNLPNVPDDKIIKQKIDDVLKKHPALYSMIEETPDGVFMVRCDFPAQGICKICTEELTLNELKDKEDNFACPFNMSVSPLCRVELYKSSGKLHIFFEAHHIVADGTSVNILYRQFIDALAGKNATDETIDPFSLYEAEQRMKKAPEYKEAQQYYEKLFGGVEADSSLIPDFNSEEEKGIHRCIRYDVHFNPSIAIEKLKQTGITKSTLFMGAFGYSLAAMTGQKESLFTVGESGRKSSVLDNTVAMMVRTLPVLMQIDENDTGITILKKLQSQFFQTIKNDSVSFAELNNNYGVNSDIAFVYQSDMFDSYISGDVSADLSVMENGDAFAKLNSSVFKFKDGFTLRLEYRRDLYKSKTIQRFAEIFVKAVDFLLSDLPMKEMELISDTDKALLRKFNDSYLSYDSSKTFVDIFRENVAKYADKTAIVFRDKHYTYKQLDDITNRLAGYIHSKGIGCEQTVSVIIPRCEYMAIASIGIIKAGAIYEPMDPAYPCERLTFMHQDADAKLVIADREMIGLLSEYNGDVLFTDEIANLPPVAETEVAKYAPDPNDTYVLLYTSGTTGKPKGCMLCHSNLTALIAQDTDMLGIDEKSRLTLYPSFGFDAHMNDLFPALANGCTIYIIPDEMRLDFPVLKNYLEENEITHAFMTTQVARQFLLEYSHVEHLQVISMGGESLQSFVPNNDYKIINLYGPTECTVYVTGYVVEKFINPIPIGHPTANNHIFVVDSYGRNVPVGVPGELIISGPQVGKGYLNRPEKTSEVFVPNTFEDNPDESHKRCYKTGDIVRWTDDGNILFIGRRDLQVKIRGYRIELSEVEQVILSYPGIKNAAVIAADVNGSKCIHAYIVADTKIDISALNSYIGSKKPSYMIPAGTMQIDAIPLTVNQKLDKRKLPPIVSGNKSEKNDTKRSLTFIEEKLMSILTDIVGECDVDVQTEFTNAGITSITSIKLASRIYKQFDFHITSKEILDGGSILSVENAIIQHLLDGKQNGDEKKEKQLLTSYPLTQTQLGIYLDSLRAGIGTYNIPLMYKLPEGISIEKLKNAVRTAISNHPSMLVYIYPDENGEPLCYPKLDMTYDIDEITLENPKPQLTEFAFEHRELFHISIIHCGNDSYLLLEIHHIICDGESMSILVQDIDKAYSSQTLENEEMTAFELSLEEQSMRKGNELIQAKSVYDSIFKGISADYIPCHDRNDTACSATLNYEISVGANDIHKFCTEKGITENIFFTSVFALTIAKYTFHDDALFATIYNGRTDPRTQRLVSMLVKTLPVYLHAEPDTAVDDYLRAVEKQLGILRQNDIFSFADAAKEYGIGADVMFVYQGRILSDAQLNGKALKPVSVGLDGNKANISAELSESDTGFEIKLDYNSGFYSSDWAYGFADAYNACVASLLKAEKLADVDITSDYAFHRFDNFNDTDIDVQYRPVYKRLTEQTSKHPDKIAIIASPEAEGKFLDANGNRIYESLTYSQLDNMTNELSRRLIALNIKPGNAVGVMTGRSKEIYLAEFGILKAGCTFVFLSPSYPYERISYICKEADIKAIITTHTIADTVGDIYSELGIQQIFADDISVDVCCSCPNIEVLPNSLAYMIYTSGSTGQPKGVMITQSNLNNLADNNEKNPQIKDLLADVMCAVSAFTFDASILDGYVAIANGATVCIASEEDIHNPSSFCDFCIENSVKSYVCTPSFEISLLDCPKYEMLAKQLHAICCGGEVFPPSLYEKLKAMNPDINLINGYGPSETTVSCSARLLTSSNSIDIGTPNNNTKIFIIDKQKHILPMGALGELVICGTGVGAGYLNRKDLTEKSFFTLNGMASYKSGDLALITNSGCIEFHGRIDNQVKLRGLRVELGEIESAINNCDGVKNSIVIVKGKDNNQYLVAYYTAEREIPYEEIKSEIAKKLTEYMVPKVFMQLDEMPMTANGKIDKKALPEAVVSVDRNEYVAPSNPIEVALCKAFAQALGVEKIGVTDNFFELGGTSLTATKIATFAMANDIHLVYKDVFTNPTVRQLSIIAGGNVKTGSDSTIDGWDYTASERSLEGNVWNYDDDAGNRPLGNILLTGATGFLGMHILKKFIDTEAGEVYCIIQKSTTDTIESRLKGIFFYYFSQSLDTLLGKRIHCIEGDITNKDFILGLSSIPFDTCINCAACVKHFANDDILERINVHGVENLVELCLENGKRIIQVSTVSVAGEGINGLPERNFKLTENVLYVHQLLENQYILSKFKAEKIVLDAIDKGLDGKIMRAGNLMPRFSDGEFQINYLTNGFARQLSGYYALGCIPYSALSGELEFSPIDDTADAILALSRTDRRFTVFHPNNIHKIYMSDVVRAMNEAGMNVDCVTEKEFADRLRNAMQNPTRGNEIGGIIAYLNHESGNERYMLGYDNTFTAKVLNRIGFHWNITGINYLVNAFRNYERQYFTLDI